MRPRIKYGTAEWKEFMARHVASRAARAAASAHPPSIGPLASIHDDDPAPNASTVGTSVKVLPEIASSTSKSVVETAPNTNAIETGEPAGHTSETGWCDWSGKPVVRERDSNPMLYHPPAIFGIVLSDSKPFGISSNIHGTYHSATRIFPSIDGSYRSIDGEVQRRPWWGAASNPSSKPFERRKERNEEYEPSMRTRGTTVHRPHLDEPLQTTVQHALPVVQSESDEPRDPFTHRNEDSQFKEQSFSLVQHSQRSLQSRDLSAARSLPKSAHHPVQGKSYPSRIIAQACHLRTFDSYGALNNGAPELRLDELRDELAIRGLPCPMTSNWKDLALLLTANDQEWRNQLLELECEILSKLWDKAKVDAFMEDHFFQYFDYGDLEASLLKNTRDKLDRNKLLAELQASHQEAFNMMLHIANQEYVILDLQTCDHHSSIAMKIAEFRARKIATEDPVRRQQCETPVRNRASVAKTPHGRPDATPIESQARNREREEDLGSCEAKPMGKKTRQDVSPVLTNTAPATVQAGAATRSTPGQSTSSAPMGEAHVNVNPYILSKTQGNKRQRGIDRDEELHTVKKKPRSDTTTAKKSSASSQVGTPTKSFSGQSPTSSRQGNLALIDVQAGLRPGLQGGKRQRDTEEDEVKPTNKRHRKIATSEKAVAAAQTGTTTRTTSKKATIPLASSAQAGKAQTQKVSNERREAQGQNVSAFQEASAEATSSTHRRPIATTHGTSNAGSTRTTRNSRKAGLNSKDSITRMQEPEEEYEWVKDSEDMSDFIDDSDEDEPVRPAKKKQQSSIKDTGLTRAQFRRKYNFVKD